MLEPGLELAEVTRTLTRALTRTLTQARNRTLALALALAPALALALTLTLTLTLGGSGLAAGRLVWFTPPYSPFRVRARGRARVRLVSLTGTLLQPRSCTPLGTTSRRARRLSCPNPCWARSRSPPADQM